MKRKISVLDLRIRDFVGGKVLGLNSSEIGTVRELLVCVDLMQKGWVVYRPINGNAACDIIISRGKETYKVEVTGGSNSNNKNHSNFDLLAVCNKRHIHYVVSRAYKGNKLFTRFEIT